MQASKSATTDEPQREYAASPYTGIPPATPMSSGWPCVTRGQMIIGVGQWCCTGTHPHKSQSGLTTPCAWTPGACSAANSPPCVTRRSSSCPYEEPGVSRTGDFGFLRDVVLFEPCQLDFIGSHI